MRVGRESDGLRLKFSAPESAMLAGLFDDLLEDLQPDALDVADPVHVRLFPSGYADDADPVDATDFRALTEAALRAERITRVEQCRAELSAHRSPWRGSEVRLDAEAADRWMRVLNDIRLTVGTRLGVSDEEDYHLQRGDPQLRDRAHYVWLTALQDLLVQAHMDE